MKVRADDQGRLMCRELFRPQGLFEAEKQTDGSVRATEVDDQETPLVKPFRTKEGFVMLPMKLDRATVAAAIRADRNQRIFNAHPLSERFCQPLG
jgi:hypothetical protein